MKKTLKIVRFALMIVLCSGAIAVSAQRGNRGHYGGYSHDYGRSYSHGYVRNNIHDYANVYRGNYSPSYRGNYNAYSYRSPVIVRNYNPVVYGPRYYGYPHGGISITFGGNPYYYSGGGFYRPYGGYYRSVFPPIGIRIGILPYGYLPVYVGPDLFYFYNGIYYRRYDDRNYEVVDAPMGAQISSLPGGAKSVIVNGENFYELNGTYYKEDRDAKGRVVYIVVGKNGRIDNTDHEPAPAPPAAEPKTGDRISQLPDNCKTVVVNGQKLYVSPNDIYYQPQPDGTYTVVGSANDNNL